MATKYLELPYRQGFYRKRGVIYVSIKGHAYCCGTDKLSEAVAFKNAKLEEFKVAEKEGIDATQNGPLMTELFADYVTHLEAKERDGGTYAQFGRTNSNRVAGFIRNHLAPVFGKLKPKEVQAKLDAYDKLRRGEKASPATINGEYRVLSATMKRAWKKKKIIFSDIPTEYPFNHKGEKKSRRKGIITDEQRDKILAEAAPHLKVVFATALDTGMRPKEIHFVRTSQVFLDDEEPRFELREGETKNGDGRTVGIFQPWVKKMLVDWREKSRREYPNCEWFFHEDGQQLGDWKTAWYGALNRADIEKGTVMFYDTRRTARTTLDTNDVRREDAKLQLGHKTDGQSDNYNQSRQGLKRIRQAVNPTPAVVVAPVAIVSDWKAELKDLKELLDGGLLPEDMYRTEVARVMASR